ncbi:MAG: type 4 prepilin-like proteins leader peptide-processing enzyme [Patescibacteria group bacterium]|nr:MAG: type 4 prepilin-like proteins leader peptide-processing enzyme [Patescibacteria group bacterium]
MSFLVFILGLVFGSFVSALSYRLPLGISFVSGRSFCPKCNRKISWYDNIPLLSFIILGGKCRNCGKKISYRYPIIELSTALGFILIYSFGQGRTLSIPLLLFVFIVLEVIFIIDLEHKVIFDGLTYLLFIFFLTTSLFIKDQNFYLNLLIAFSLSLFLLFLHLVTKGHGMGLGDVKLALPLGFFMGFPLGVLWIFISFLTGAILGVILILIGKAKFGKQIPFGPFLVFSFWLVFLFGEKLILFLR